MFGTTKKDLENQIADLKLQVESLITKVKTREATLRELRKTKLTRPDATLQSRPEEDYPTNKQVNKIYTKKTVKGQ